MIFDLAAAIAFLTRLPVGGDFAFDAKAVARSERWFPLVGALIGGISVAILWLAVPIFHSLLTAIVLAGANALLTGALHLDGVADTADGFGGGWTREDVMRIMKDHAIGSYGAIALILVLVLKIVTIATLIDAHRVISALIVAPVVSRWSAVLLSATQPYARQLVADGQRSIGPIAPFVGRTELIIASVTAVVIGAALDRWRGPAACMLVAVSSALWGWCCRRRIGGITGDTLGANVEISECMVLLLFTALR